LAGASDILVVCTGCLERLAAHHGVVSETPHEAALALRYIPLKEVELVYSALVVQSRFRWKVETPFLSVGEDRKRDAAVKCVLEELAIPTLELSDALHLEKRLGVINAIAECEVDARSFDLVLRRNALSVEDRPIEGLKEG